MGWGGKNPDGVGGVRGVGGVGGGGVVGGVGVGGVGGGVGLVLSTFYVLISRNHSSRLIRLAMCLKLIFDRPFQYVKLTLCV